MVDRELHTLDSWRQQFDALPRTIECSVMKLWGRDDEGVIFNGPGRIEVGNDARIRFFLYGTAIDDVVAFKKLRTAKAKPYDTLEQFRLFATDYSGVEWVGGWTDVRFFTDYNHGWPLTGELSGLLTRVTGPWVATSSSVELLFMPPLELPMSESLVSVSTIGSETVLMSRGLGRHSVAVLGTTVSFANEPSGDALWVTAGTSAELAHPFAERCLSEPLRILLGATIHPRMIARNLGDGTADVSFLPTAQEWRPSAFGLMQPFGLNSGHDAAFWKLYADILTVITKAPSSDGGRDLESHALTRIYEELAQVQDASRWTMLLNLASSAEALAKKLMSSSGRMSEFSDEATTSMAKHIAEWKGDSALRSRMLSNLGMVKERSVLAFMRSLAKTGVVKDEHVNTWHKLRNRVMHGNLVEPWSTEEGDGHLREMTTLVHSLTRALIAKG